MVSIPFGVERQAFIQGNSKPYRANTGLGVVIGEVVREPPPGAVRLDIDWSLYGITAAKPFALIEIDLASQAVEQPLSVIRSVYIDNSEGYTTVFVIFPDTQYTIPCPPHTVLWLPVLTGGATALVYSDGFFSLLPTCKIHFSNIDVGGFSVTFPVRGPNGFLIGGQSSFTALPAASAQFISFPLGTPAQPSRLFVAALALQSSAGVPSLNITAVTNNGVAGVLLQSNFFQAVGIWYRLAMYYFVAPTGAPNIVVTTNNNMDFAMCAAWAVYNSFSQAPYESDIILNKDMGVVSAAPFLVEGSYCAMASLGSSAGAPVGQSWTGARLIANFNAGHMQFAAGEINSGSDDFISTVNQTSRLTEYAIWN